MCFTLSERLCPVGPQNSIFSSSLYWRTIWKKFWKKIQNGKHYEVEKREHFKNLYKFFTWVIARRFWNSWNFSKIFSISKFRRIRLPLFIFTLLAENNSLKKFSVENYVEVTYTYCRYALNSNVVPIENFHTFYSWIFSWETRNTGLV